MEKKNDLRLISYQEPFILPVSLLCFQIFVVQLILFYTKSFFFFSFADFLIMISKRVLHIFHYEDNGNFQYFSNH